jgi:hypothetical protein
MASDRSVFLPTLAGNGPMINFAIGIVGLVMVILSPVIPFVFSGIGRKWMSVGFIAGLLIVGSAFAP